MSLSCGWVADPEVVGLVCCLWGMLQMKKTTRKRWNEKVEGVTSASMTV